MNTTLLLIANRDVAATDGAVFDRSNPLDGSIATRAAAASVADARAAADAAAVALPLWSALGPNARRGFLLKAADELEDRTGDFECSMAAEIGSTKLWAQFNVRLAASMLREAASLTTQVGGEVIPSDQPGCFAWAVRRPAGVVLGIAPWNAPVILGVRAVATPLACGNTVVLKASEICPATHRLIGEALRAAGLPPGVINVVTNAPAGASDIVASLIAHPAVRRINFTGSTKVGRTIARLAAEQLKPALLELGGKAPLVILDDANLDQAFAAAAFGAYMNSGQICMSTEKLIVDERIAARFVAQFRAKVATLEAGDPSASRAPLGSVVDAAAAARIRLLMDDAVNHGAELFEAAAPRGTLLSAAILDRVTPAMRIYHEESFGPVVIVLRAADDADAIRLANDSAYGLTSAVFSRDVARALSVAEQIHAGMCHINGPTVHDEAQMPFGGTKESGYGRFGGTAGIAEFTELRWITLATAAGQYPI
jgi:acyl-CoA reductase-like NAD-dependent aldehyde dehydrogenase